MATAGVAGSGEGSVHLLVIGGEPDILRGRPGYALCCHLLARVTDHVPDITILTARSLADMAAEDVGFKETRLRDGDFLEPEPEPGDAESSSSPPRDFVDALDRWERFYANLEYAGISHVLVVNPEGVVALADTKLVEYLGDMRVAVVNTRSPLSLAAQAATDGGITDVDFLGWTKKDASLVMSIGPHVHALWEQELESSGVALERVHVNIAPFSPLCFTKAASAAGGVSGGVCHIHTLPMGADEGASGGEFLQTVARALSSVALALNTQHKSLAWTVWTHAPTPNNTNTVTVSREALQATLGKLLAHRVELNVLPLTSLDQLEKQLQKSSLVIQDGRLDRPCGGYSGLETLMCGVPTLLQDRSPELSHLLLSINEPKARYFVLPNETDAWPDKILQVLEDEEKAIEHALDLAKVVQEQHKDSLRAFATWLGVPDASSDASDSPDAPPPAPPTLRPFLRRSDFTCVEGEVLGAGGFGKVYCGRYQQHDVAVKCIQAHMKARVVAEIEILKAIQHENIVSVHGICISAGKVYIVMEKLPCNLADKIKQNNQNKKDPQRQVSLEKKLEVAVGIVKAVAYIHTQHIVHQDIKPLNVLLTEDLVPKLCDFGLSRVKTHLSKATSTQNSIGGTPQYFAPELHHPRYRPQKPADVWAVACTLVEWFAGRLWASKQRDSVQREIASGKPPLGLAKVDPQWLKEVLARGFEQQPANRPQAQQMVDWIASRTGPPQQNAPRQNRNQHAMNQRPSPPNGQPNMGQLNGQPNMGQLNRQSNTGQPNGQPNMGQHNVQVTGQPNMGQLNMALPNGQPNRMMQGGVPFPYNVQPEYNMNGYGNGLVGNMPYQQLAAPQSPQYHPNLAMPMFGQGSMNPGNVPYLQNPAMAPPGMNQWVQHQGMNQMPPTSQWNQNPGAYMYQAAQAPIPRYVEEEEVSGGGGIRPPGRGDSGMGSRFQSSSETPLKQPVSLGDVCLQAAGGGGGGGGGEAREGVVKSMRPHLAPLTSMLSPQPSSTPLSQSTSSTTPTSPQAPPTSPQAPPTSSQAPPTSSQAPPTSSQAPPTSSQAPRRKKAPRSSGESDTVYYCSSGGSGPSVCHRGLRSDLSQDIDKLKSMSRSKKK